MKFKKDKVVWILITFGTMMLMLGMQCLLISSGSYGEKNSLLLVGGLTVEDCKKYILVSYENLWWIVMGNLVFFRLWNTMIQDIEHKLIRYCKQEKLYLRSFFEVIVIVFFIMFIKLVITLILKNIWGKNNISFWIFFKSIILQLLFYYLLIQLQILVYLNTKNILLTFFSYGILLIFQLLAGFLYGRVVKFQIIIKTFIPLYLQPRMYQWSCGLNRLPYLEMNFGLLVVVSSIIITLLFYINKIQYKKWIEE